MTESISNYKAWYASIMHTEEFKVLKQLKSYKSVGTYIISLEVCSKSHQATGGQHMHFLVEMDNKDFNAFRDWQKRHFSLQCKAEDSGARQFGKVKNIENLSRMAIYTVKHENVRTNMSDELLRLLVKQSFIKIDKKDEVKMLYKHLDDKIHIPEGDHWMETGGIREVKKEIIRKILLEKYSTDLNAPTIDRVFRNWLKSTDKIDGIQKEKIFFHICI